MQVKSKGYVFATRRMAELAGPVRLAVLAGPVRLDVLALREWLFWL